MIHAEDFLIDYSKSKPHWLRALIYYAILTNGKIEKKELDLVYQSLVDDIPVPIPVLTTVLPHAKEACFAMEGVVCQCCAKIERFMQSEGVKVICRESFKAKNASFKMFGSADFQQKNLTKSFCGAAIFGSDYISNSLSVREKQRIKVNPLGLHLFEYILQEINAIRNKLIADADKAKSEKPLLALEHIPYRKAFKNHRVTTAIKNAVESQYAYTEEQRERQKELYSSFEKYFYSSEEPEMKIISRSMEKKELIEGFSIIEKSENQLRQLYLEVKRLLGQKHNLGETYYSQIEQCIADIKKLPHSISQNIRIYNGTLLDSAINQLNNFRELLLDCIRREDSNCSAEFPDIQAYKDEAINLSERLQESIDTLQVQLEERNMMLEEYFTNQANEIISKQKQVFELWFQKDAEEKKFRKISRRPLYFEDLSVLLLTAREILLSKKFLNIFNDKLAFLGYSYLSDIGRELNKEEQNVFALCLFLAEAQMYSKELPLVFNKPTDGLTHKANSQFVRCLLGLDNRIFIITDDEYLTAELCKL